VRLDEAACFHPERKPELYQVSRGDILVVARGQDHRAHHVDQDLSNALAAATFYIVRVTTERIQPGYLAWWLNMPGVQAEIDANSRGTSIRYIGRETLENLRVPVPALDVQRRIERVASLWREKKSLHSRIDQKREQYIQAVCQQAVRQAKE
jgi:restriction endonuclease S subunit